MPVTRAVQPEEESTSKNGTVVIGRNDLLGLGRSYASVDKGLEPVVRNER